MATGRPTDDGSVRPDRPEHRTAEGFGLLVETQFA